MPDDTQRQVATDPDLPRRDATSPDQYTLTIEDALVRYEHAGHPRTVRSIQRYCAKGHLDCLRQETTFGDKYMITPESVARHIAQIAELASATRRDLPRQDAAEPATPGQAPPAVSPVTTTGDVARQDATSRAVSEPATAPANSDERYVHQLERENEFLRDQIQRKDEQIGELSERARETNFLIKGLQELVLRLQPGRAATAINDGQRMRDADHADSQAG